MTVLITRQLRRFVARLLVGVVIYAQLALGAYACPPPSFDAVGTSDVTMAATASMLEGQGAGAEGVGSELTWHLDSAQPGLCAAHCQSGHQNIDVKPVPSPVLALMAGYFSLEPTAQVAGHVRPPGLADSPPPQADPPHAILHCCFRI